MNFSSGPEFHSNLPSASIVGATQQAAIAVSSAWSALYFSLRVKHGPRGRRIAARILMLLFAALALEALAGVSVSSTSAEVARRTPLLLATVSVALFVSYRPRAAR